MTFEYEDRGSEVMLSFEFLLNIESSWSLTDFNLSVISESFFSFSPVITIGDCFVEILGAILLKFGVLIFSA